MTPAQQEDRIRVAVISRLRAFERNGRLYSIDDNIARAYDICLQLSLAGLAPFAPHGFYTQFLDDRNPDERRAGMESGAAWIRQARVAVIDAEFDLSSGMMPEIELVAAWGTALYFVPTLAGLSGVIERIKKDFNAGGTTR